MPRTCDVLIADLVDGLEPVRPLRLGTGLALAVGAAALAAGVVIALFGLRADLAAGRFNPMHLLTGGMYFGLGLAGCVTVVTMSRPQVGSDHSGWKWAAGMAGFLPLAALVVGLGRPHVNTGSAQLWQGVDHVSQCIGIGGSAAMIVFAMLIWWLRRGAPTAPDRAGLVAGIAAGAFGTFAFMLHCPDNDIVHLGLWHSAPVLAMAVIGRTVAPRLIRW